MTDRWSGTGGGVFGFNQTATGDALASLLTGWALSGSRAEALLLRRHARTPSALYPNGLESDAEADFESWTCGGTWTRRAGSWKTTGRIRSTSSRSIR